MKKRCFFALLAALLVAGCGGPITEPEPKPEDHDFTVVIGRHDAAAPYTGFSGGPVWKISSADYTQGGGTRGITTLSGLDRHSVFLVRVNRSDTEIDALDSGWAFTRPQGTGSSSERFAVSGPIPAEFPQFQPAGKLILKDDPEAMAFNNGPAPTQSARWLRDMGTMSTYALGDTRNFWVQDENEAWIELPATLRAESAKAKVWIADASYSDLLRPNDRLVTTSQAQEIANKFNLVYGYTTEIFGREPGGPGAANPGGIDGDAKIHILIYDIDFDQGTGNANTAGFFWAKDLYAQADINNWDKHPQTNLAEMFYLDAEFTEFQPKAIYSTLIHEFQHMISYHEKRMVRGLPGSSNPWYTEMMAMLAEDLIGPQMGIGFDDPGHPAYRWAVEFMVNYSALGVNKWNTEDLMVSYANAYEFGAYLVRNFGGAALLKEMASNNYMDTASVNAALSSSVNPVPGVRTWQDALGRYGEALIYGNDIYQSDRLSFNRISETIPFYSFSAVNLWSRPYRVPNIVNFPAGYRGPLIPSLYYGFGMNAHALLIQSYTIWQNVSGNLEVSFQRPNNPNVDLYIMVR
ncbi:MAG: hypothetical protein LBK27_07505 [Treponema sp.]|jgi:hypothetical protein|nr:hypothetical protein [Treponema sp.]